MYMVHPYLRIYLKWKNNERVYLSWDKPPHNGTMELTSPFTTGVKPDMNQLTLYNLTKEEFADFLEKRTIEATAGFYNSDYTYKNGGTITKGTIKSSTPLAQDGVDRTVQINFNHFPEINSEPIKVKKVTKVRVAGARKKASGKSATELIRAYNQKKTKELNAWLRNNPNVSAHTRSLERKKIASQRKRYATKTRKKYSKKTKAKAAKAKYVKQIKYANLSFKAGTKASTIIRTVAKKGKVPLGAVKLTYDRKYPNGYTVSGKPINALNKLAESSSTTAYIENGKLYIREITTGQKAKLQLTPETGLLTHPTPSDDGTYNGQKFETQCLMRKEIHVGALVYIDDGVKNYGKCVVLGGQREFTANSSTITFQFVPYSAYRTANSARLKKAKSAAAKDHAKAKLKAKNKRAKDSKRRSTVKSKRKARRK